MHGKAAKRAIIVGLVLIGMGLFIYKSSVDSPSGTLAPSSQRHLPRAFALLAAKLSAFLPSVFQSPSQPLDPESLGYLSNDDVKDILGEIPQPIRPPVMPPPPPPVVDLRVDRLSMEAGSVNGARAERRVE